MSSSSTTLTIKSGTSTKGIKEKSDFYSASSPDGFGRINPGEYQFGRNAGLSASGNNPKTIKITSENNTIEVKL